MLDILDVILEVLDAMFVGKKAREEGKKVNRWYVLGVAIAILLGIAIIIFAFVDWMML